MNKKIILLFILSMVSLSSIAIANEPHINTGVVDDDYFLIHRPDVDLSKLDDPFYSHLLKMRIESKLAMERLNLLDQRKREPLEGFELESLRVSGIYSMHNRRYVTIEDNLGHGYTLTVGNYLGRNNGVIQSIDKRKVTILEKLLTPTGTLKSVKITLSLKDL